MTTADFTLSYMLRNSGEVLNAVDHTDVKLARRDGADLHVGTMRRETAVRDSLDLAARALGAVLSDPDLSEHAMNAIEEALPWVGWLDVEGRHEFAVGFIRTTSACHDTGNYEPLAKLLNRWRASAQIAQSPELSALLSQPRGADERIALARPRS